MSYIGENKIKESRVTGEKTPGGYDIMEVIFEDGSTEWFSKMMFDRITTETPCDASLLRDKRVHPVVEMLLVVVRDWGVKIGELPYLSALLNQSLNFNQDEAMKTMWAQWMPKPKSLDEVDLLSVDRVLRSVRKTLDDVLNETK